MSEVKSHFVLQRREVPFLCQRAISFLSLINSTIIYTQTLISFKFQFTSPLLHISMPINTTNHHNKMNNTNNILPSNPNAIKTRFAIKFLQAMKRLRNKSNGAGARDRYRAVRAAARTSMASAVGPGRAWSRAVLRKRRNVRLIQKQRRFGVRNPNYRGRQEEDLRGVVPGGEEMEFCSLLSETAHYIICLQAQVQVMTHILHTSSSSSSS